MPRITNYTPRRLDSSAVPGRQCRARWITLQGRAWVVHAAPGVDLLLVRMGKWACLYAICYGARAAWVRTAARG